MKREIPSAGEVKQPKSWTLLDVIRKLTPLQQEALSRICCGDDSCLNLNTAKALAAKGLIDYGLVSEGGGLSLYRAEVASIAVHYAWCVWCSEQPGEDVG